MNFLNNHVHSSEDTAPRSDPRALIEELIAAEIRATEVEVERMTHAVTSKAAGTRNRLGEVARGLAGEDPALLHRVTDFADAMGIVEMRLREALEDAWSEARALLVEAGREATFRPGEEAPASGQYEIISADGVATGEGRTMVRGHTFPPTPESDQTYRLARAARNGAGLVSN